MPDKQFLYLAAEYCLTYGIFGRVLKAPVIFKFVNEYLALSNMVMSLNLTNEELQEMEIYCLF